MRAPIPSPSQMATACGLWASTATGWAGAAATGVGTTGGAVEAGLAGADPGARSAPGASAEPEMTRPSATGTSKDG